MDDLRKELETTRARLALLTSAEGLSSFSALVDDLQKFLESVACRELDAGDAIQLQQASSSPRTGDTAGASSANKTPRGDELSWSLLSACVQPLVPEHAMTSVCAAHAGPASTDAGVHA